MARAGKNPKTLQYLMGHSDIGVTMNTYTHLGLEDAQNEMVRLEELNRAKEEVAKAAGEKKPLTQMNIPAAGYRQSGEMETVVPAFWKPLFRRFGNRCPARACSGC